jgi:hypothetical protein
VEVLRRLPRRLVVDNLKAVVTRADRYAPTIARVFLEYAQYRGFVVDPCPAPRHRETERGARRSCSARD